MSDSWRMSFSVSFAMASHFRQGGPRDLPKSTNPPRSFRTFGPVRSPPVTKVAIVDDHEAMREGLERLLADRGMQVVGTAGDIAAARDLVAAGAPDVALVDIRLPDGSGIDLTKTLLADHPRLGVVLYTGHADAELLYGGLDSGARGYVLKAGSLSELAGAIESGAAGGTYVDPRLDRILLSAGATSRVQQLSPRERQIT